MGVSLRFFETTENHPRPQRFTARRGNRTGETDKNRRHYCHQYKHDPFWSKNRCRKTQNYRKRRTERQSDQQTFNRSHPLSDRKIGQSLPSHRRWRHTLCRRCTGKIRCRSRFGTGLYGFCV